MAKANPGGGKDYEGTSEPAAQDGYETPHGDASGKDPETKLLDKQVELLKAKAREKRLQAEIDRLTAYNATTKAWEGEVNGPAREELTRSRRELANFVESEKKALDDPTKDQIAKVRDRVRAEVDTAKATYERTVDKTKEMQAALAVKQADLSKATEAYAKAKAVTAAKQTTTDLLAVRQKIEALVKADKFTEAGFWLYELEDQSEYAALDKALGQLSAAWGKFEGASDAVGAAEDALTEANYKEAAAKKAFEDATKNRISKITGLLEADQKKAAA